MFIYRVSGSLVVVSGICEGERGEETGGERDCHLLPTKLPYESKGERLIRIEGTKIRTKGTDRQRRRLKGG